MVRSARCSPARNTQRVSPTLSAMTVPSDVSRSSAARTRSIGTSSSFSASGINSSVGSLEPDATDVPCQSIWVLRHDLHGLGAIGLEDPHRPRCADAVTVQEDHNLANDLLLRPGGSDAAGSDSADASDLTQAL